MMGENLRRVLMATGSRADLDLNSAVVRAVRLEESWRDMTDITMLVAGAHWSPRFGGGRDQEVAFHDGTAVKRITLPDNDEPGGRAAAYARLCTVIADIMADIQFTEVVAVGDREEALALATVASYMQVPVIHVGGGDGCWGNVDDTVRHAISKLAAYHLVNCRESQENLEHMGEDRNRIMIVGHVGLDKYLDGIDAFVMQASRLRRAARLEQTEAEHCCLAVAHPVNSTRGSETAEHVAREILSALEDTGRRWHVFFMSPNSDAWSRAGDVLTSSAAIVLEKVVQYGREQWCRLMRDTVDLVVGNSSLGILETPFLGIPTVTVGQRQVGRHFCSNVIHADCNAQAIARAVSVAMSPTFFRRAVDCDPTFGDGRSKRAMSEFFRMLRTDPHLRKPKGARS